jgi:hypothetical protein
MTWYSPNNTYSNQFQYYHPYSYSSYPSTLDGMMTGRKNCLKNENINLYVYLDSSFQNGYYAVDGTTSKGLRKGLKHVWNALSFGFTVGSTIAAFI